MNIFYLVDCESFGLDDLFINEITSSVSSICIVALAGFSTASQVMLYFIDLQVYLTRVMDFSRFPPILVAKRELAVRFIKCDYY